MQISLQGKKMNKKLVLFGVGLCVCAGAAIYGQQNDSLAVRQLDEVVVTDSRFELQRENSGKTVIKIGALELSRSQGKTVAEIINAKSGIEISGSRGRQGEVLGVFTRGGRGRQVLVLIDGVRVTDPSSFSQEYDLRLLSTADIESIEIIKGAASTLYGANAATAVINISTKKASAKPISGQFQTSLGTNQVSDDQNFNALGDFSNSVNVNGSLGKFSYVAGFSNQFANGISSLNTTTNEEDIYSRTNMNLRLGYRFSKAFQVSVYGNQTKLSSDFDESFGLLDAPYQFLTEQKRVGLASDINYTAGALHLNAALSSYDSESISAFPNTFSGSNFVLDVYNKYTFNERLYTIVGLNYIEDKADFEASEQFALVDPYFNAVYVSDVGFNLNTGLRLNNHSEYGSNLVYNLNPSYRFKTANGYFKLLGSYATSYITPSLTQLFGAFGPNPDLEPEENRTVEGGMEYAVGTKFRISGLYFNRKETNAVIFDNSAFQYFNSEGEIDAQGAEVELNWAIDEAISLSANYTFTERKGDNAIRIPKHKINGLLGYQICEPTYISLGYQYTGQRMDTDFATFSDVELEAFSLLDLYISHQLIEERLKVFLNASNLLNEDYVEVIGFNTRGRNIRLGLNLSF